MHKVVLKLAALGLIACLWLTPAAAQEVSPEAAASFIKAKALLAQDKIDEALKELETTLTLDPKLYLAYFLRGIIHEGRKNYDQAIADYTKTIDIHAFGGPYIHRGRCYMFKGQAQAALADFAKAESLSPQDGDIYVNRAFLYFTLKQYDKAKQDVAKAQALGKKLPETFLEKLTEASRGAAPPKETTSQEGSSGSGKEVSPAPRPAPQPAPGPTPGPVPGPTTETLPQLIKRVLPAVGTIYVYDISDNLVGNGTGFFINNQGHLVTNYHVLANKTRAKVKLGGKLYPIKGVLATNQRVDLALAQVEAPAGAYSVLPLAKTPPEVGEKVLVVGAPLGLEQSASEGIIAAIRVVSDAGLPQVPVLQLTAPISSGSSGGPVLNLKGEVVGVVTFLRRGGQNLNFAVPYNHVQALQAGSLKPLSQAMLDQDTLKAQAYYEKGKKLYDAGKYQDALEAFKQAVGLYADYARAYNYLGLTYRHLKKYPEAQKAYAQAIKLNPQNSVYVYNLGMLYYHLDYYKEARQTFATAVKLSPKDPDIYFMLGKACVQVKDRVTAVQCYEMLKKLDARRAQELYKLINK